MTDLKHLYHAGHVPMVQLVPQVCSDFLIQTVSFLDLRHVQEGVRSNMKITNLKLVSHLTLDKARTYVSH
jgi:hypothetical protein